MDFKTSGFPIDRAAESFCREFLSEAAAGRRIVLGRNKWAASIAGKVEISSFVDDFTTETQFLGRPIIKGNQIPKGSLVVSASILHQLTAHKKLVEQGVRCLGYFTFKKYSGLELEAVLCSDDFVRDFARNSDRFARTFERLADPESRDVFRKLVQFRLSSDLSFMDGFRERQEIQYFEGFLGLRPEGEVFVDIGGFHGETSLQFAKLCPKFRGIYFFEPEKANMDAAMSRLSGLKNVRAFKKGLSDKPGTLRFDASGSTSKVSEAGAAVIEVMRLDEAISADLPPTLIKMDIEGAEKSALAGARTTIEKYHPRLAIAVYHEGDDFYRIPEQILSYREDYELHLRHYTEGTVETVMFFMPKGG